jgi:maltose alpha-D-glucosyltransferase / alpha-amylase
MCAPLPFPENAGAELENTLDFADNPPSQLARDHVGIYLDAAATLGRRTAELHRALASPTGDPAFAPEPLSSDDAEALASRVRQRASATFDLLRDRLPFLSEEVIEIAASVLSRRRQLLQRLQMPGHITSGGQRIRIHGDYHLGQVLRVKTDFVILDFEGEPTRPLPDRRAKQSPLKDVAGMLRSFSYAAYASLSNFTARHPGDVANLERWAQLWQRSATAEFLRAYRQTAGAANFVPARTEDFRALLDVFLLDKVLYEVAYELNSRPAWVRIPLLGILSLSP